MGVQPVQDLRFLYPCWPVGADTWTRLRATTNAVADLPAGITFVTSPAHPLNTDQNEQVIHVDGNQAHRIAFAKVFNGAPSGIIAVSSHRWALRESFLIRFASTMTSPSSRARLIGDDAATANSWALFLNTDMTLGLDLYDSSGVTSVSLASSRTMAKDDAWYQLEVWRVIANSAGTALASCQWVVRTIANLTSTRDATTYLNVLDHYDTISSDHAITFVTYLGESTTRGAGFVYDIASPYGAIEDADSPYGVIRGDLLSPNGTGAYVDWGDNVPGDVDDIVDTGAPGRIPDDATTIDSASGGAGLTQRNSYDVTAPGHATNASDSVIGVVVGLRGTQTGLGKGETGTISFDALIGDGGTTNRLTGITGLALLGAYRSSWVPFLSNPSNANWAQTDLAALEAGVQLVSTASAGHPTSVTAITATVAYQANGETTAALPLPPSLPLRRTARYTGR